MGDVAIGQFLIRRHEIFTGQMGNVSESGSSAMAGSKQKKEQGTLIQLFLQQFG